MTRVLRDNGLALFFFAILLGSLVGQMITGQHAYNEEAALHGSQEVSLGRYVLSSEFGRAMLENWQSEFLVVGSMPVFAVYLRARGATESKPVGTPHDRTGVSN